MWTKVPNLAYLTSRQDVKDFLAIQHKIKPGRTRIVYSPPNPLWDFPWDLVPEGPSGELQVRRLRSAWTPSIILSQLLNGTKTLTLGNPRSRVGKVLARLLKPERLVLLDDGVATLRYWEQIRQSFSSFPDLSWFSKYHDLDTTGRALPLPTEDFDLQAAEGHAVFLGSPLVEDSHIMLSDMVAQLQVCMRDRKIEHITYFPHPRETWFENLELRNVKVISGQKLSIEKLFEFGVAPAYVATFCSSSILDFRRIPACNNSRLEVRVIPSSLRLQQSHDIWKVGRFIDGFIRTK